MFAGPLEAKPWEVVRNSTCSPSPEHFEPVPSCFVARSRSAKLRAFRTPHLRLLD